DTPIGRMGVVISWEVFFGGRARDAVGHGGQGLLNPTNGSSYTGTILQTQQIASARLRALETGRWVVQVSPTGFRALLTPTRHRIERTRISEEAVHTRTIERRAGETWYVRIGDKLIVLLAMATVLTSILLARRSRRRRPAAPSDLEPDGDRAVVDQLDG